MKRKVKEGLWWALLVPAHALAADTRGSARLSENLLRIVAHLVTGPVGVIAAVVALVGAIIILSGVDLDEFGRRCLLAVMAVTLLVIGISFMTTLFNVSGGLV